MRNLFLLLILLITTAKSVSSQDVEDQLQYTLDSICTEQGLVGISAAVRLGNQLVWSGTSGYNNPYTEDTLRVDMNGSIASNTKMFTSVSLLQLVSEGKIALEDTIGTWQPSSPIINGSITIRQLLNHTSGLGDYTTQQWVDSIQSNPARIWTIDELFTTFLTNPVDEPGIKFKYSNAGYLILGKIIEIIEDKPFSQILHERIFEPLAMTYTYTPIDDQPNSEVMLPWFDIDNDGELDNMLDYSMNAMHSSALSAGYIYSTPEDLSKFLPALFDNSLFNQNLLEEMTTTLPASSLYHYGLGILEYTIFDKPYFGHTGQYIGYQSFTSYEPESKLSIAFILNQTFADSYEIGKVLGQKATIIYFPLKAMTTFHHRLIFTKTTQTQPIILPQFPIRYQLMVLFHWKFSIVWEIKWRRLWIPIKRQVYIICPSMPAISKADCISINSLMMM